MTTVGERVEQVRTLQEGDTVRFRNVNWPKDSAVTGKVYLEARSGLLREPHVAGHPLMTMAACGTLVEFEIVARAADCAKAREWTEVKSDPIADALREARAGDVVRFRRAAWPEGSANTGPVYALPSGRLAVGGWNVRAEQSKSYAEFEIAERAPRPAAPVYVNSERTAPVPGDIVQGVDDETNQRMWIYVSGKLQLPWAQIAPVSSIFKYGRNQLPARLRLLVDGKTGKAVPE